VWVRRGGLAGEEGGLCLRVGGCEGGVVDLCLARDGVFVLGSRVLGERPSGSLGPGRVVSVRGKASKAAFPPRMVRMCIGPCDEGTNCTLHLISSGTRSEFLSLPLGRFGAVVACTRGVGTPASRLVIEVMRKPCAYWICASWRVQSSGSHRTRNSSKNVDLLLCLMRGGAHLARTRLMPALSPLASLPRRGSLVVSALRLRSAFRLSAFRRRGDGKCRVSLGMCTVVFSVVSLGWRVSALLMECCRVALSS